MKQLLKNPFLHLIIGIISFLLLYFSVYFFDNNNPDYKKFKTSLNNKEKVAEQILDELIAHQTTDNFSYNKKYNELNKQKGLSFYIIENNKLSYWTDRSISFSPSLSQFKKPNGIAKLKNGWHQYLIKESNRKKYLALILIKHNYTIKNKYLKNSFHKSFRISDEVELITAPNKKGEAIQSKNGSFLFSLYDVGSYSSLRKKK